MYLSPREKQLSVEFLSSPSPIFIQKMMNLLKVSKRTTYHELDSFEVSLKSVNTFLRRAARGSFVIEASGEVLGQLKEDTDGKSNDLSTARRQHATLAELLLMIEPLNPTYSMESHCISNTVFYADIKQLKGGIRQLPLEIIRNQKYKIEGPERYRRLLTASALGLEVNEYGFFHNTFFGASLNYFSRFADPQHLSFTHKVIGEELIQERTNLSDEKLERLVLILTSTMERVTKDHLLASEMCNSPVNKELPQTARQLSSWIVSETRQLYSISEIVLFAELLNDFTNSFDQNFFEETFDTQLAYLVEQLIQEVSKEMNAHLHEGEILYKILLVHLSDVFSRAVLQEKTLTNPILEEITVQYEEIANIVREVVERIFQERELSEEGITYMIPHLANSLERSPKESSISAAGFSPDELASTSILELRLKRYFPFTQQTRFYRTANLKKIDLQEEYDVITSTSVLSGHGGKYILVSPLLLGNGIRRLKEAFSHTERKRRRKATYNSNNEWMIEDTHEETTYFMDQINQLFGRFFIQELDNPKTILGVIRSLFPYFPEGLITGKEVVHRRLLKQYKQIPIGISHTSVGLSHTSSSLTSKPTFCIFNLKYPLTIEEMDRQPVDLSRMLVMLASSPIQGEDGVPLGKISGAIIVNGLSIETFRLRSKEIVYRLSAKILTEEIRK